MHEKKRFKCEFCNKMFGRKSGLIKHVRIHTNEKPFDCNYCQAKFRSKPQLVSHERIHTNERPYECEGCQTRFKSKMVLLRHQKSVKRCEENKVRHEFNYNNERKNLGNSSKSQAKKQNAKETSDESDDNEDDWENDLEEELEKGEEKIVSEGLPEFQERKDKIKRSLEVKSSRPITCKKNL